MTIDVREAQDAKAVKVFKVKFIVDVCRVQ
jgi:hypothetical protein